MKAFSDGAAFLSALRAEPPPAWLVARDRFRRDLARELATPTKDGLKRLACELMDAAAGGTPWCVVELCAALDDPTGYVVGLEYGLVTRIELVPMMGPSAGLDEPEGRA